MQFNENPSVLSLSDQNILCIWYHDKNLCENIYSIMRNRLNMTFNLSRIFNDPCEFAAYLICSTVVQIIFFIIISKLALSLCAIADKRPQNKKVYELQPASYSANGSSVFTDINKLFMQIFEDTKAFLEKNQSISAVESPPTRCCKSIVSPPWSVWNSKITENSFRYWKKESPEFFRVQTLTRILIKMKCDDDRSFDEMIQTCREYYINNTTEVQKIDNFKKNYKATNAIWHYTQDSFVFRLVGRAFRLQEIECIFKFRRYIIDIHCELGKLIEAQRTLQIIPKLYRGKKIRTAVLRQLQDNVGALISMNGFLSTTKNIKIALNVYAGVGQNRLDHESVLFIHCIDQVTITKTYADISGISQYPEEEEVLFGIGSVWRIDSVQKNNSLHWTVRLSSCNDVNLRIIQFFDNFEDDATLLMLGDVLRELGQQIKAEKFYNKMLDEPTIKDETRIILYYNIAMINIEQKKDDVALKYLRKAEKLIPARVINPKASISQPLDSNSTTPSPIHIFNNLARLYQNKDDTKGALRYFTKALNVKGSDQIDKATAHDDIGLLYYGKGNYTLAREHLLQAVKLAQGHSSLSVFKQHYDVVGKHLHSRKTSVGG